MRTALAGAVMALLVASAAAEAQPTVLSEKRCLFAAAQKIPPIAGLTIKAARARQPTLHELAGRPILIVEIDVAALGHDATYGYRCAEAPGGNVVADAMGILK